MHLVADAGLTTHVSRLEKRERTRGPGTFRARAAAGDPLRWPGTPVRPMIGTRPARSTEPTSPGSRAPLHDVSSIAARLFLLGCAGVVMQLGWAIVWTLSYR